ncbi:hypothetical protein BKI52_40220 [marine bacterium AO1-C]|nr:hypothetical protein BKI52_40220 [marine bacterium AO1-C]
MDELAFNQVVTYYVRQRFKGMDFGQIRAELSQKGLNTEVINRLVKAIDNQELYKVESKSNRQRGIEYILLGFMLFISPCFLLIPHNFTKNATQEILYWLCGIGLSLGIPLLALGIRKYLQKPSDYKGYPTIRGNTSSERNINYHSSEYFDID